MQAKSAKAGLNLNLAGAVSGLFSSSSKKETGEDGSSVETKTEKAKVNGTYSALRDDAS